MDKYFQIGDFCFRLICPATFQIPENFLLFEKKEAEIYEKVEETLQKDGVACSRSVEGKGSKTKKHVSVYRCDIASKLPAPDIDGTLIAKREDLLVYALPNGREARWLGIKGQKEFYAYYEEMDDEQVQILFVEKKLRSLYIDPLFTSLFALERQMIRHDSFIFHCAYVRYEGKALLFSAPSEGGKTTQANLWEKYKKSETINGDRSLLRKIDGVWHACGWPVCGSSEVCHAKDTPIHAIVMIRQGKENHARRLSVLQAFSLLYAQVTVNLWNQDFVGHVISLMEDLLLNVPVYELTCDISKEAVDVLDGVIYGRQ